jgi:anti-sigma factor RsiW
MSAFGRRGFAGGGFGSDHLGDSLSALLDGELPAAQAEGARAHLAGCPDCARELDAVGQARSWVRALPPVDPPFGFYERMLLDGHPALEAAFAARTPPNVRRRAGLAALGAAAAAATVLGVGSPSPRPVNPSVPRLVEAHATSASVGADLLSKLAPAGVPFSFGR